MLARPRIVFLCFSGLQVVGIAPLGTAPTRGQPGKGTPPSVPRVRRNRCLERPVATGLQGARRCGLTPTRDPRTRGAHPPAFISGFRILSAPRPRGAFSEQHWGVRPGGVGGLLGSGLRPRGSAPPSRNLALGAVGFKAALQRRRPEELGARGWGGGRRKTKGCEALN